MDMSQINQHSSFHHEKHSGDSSFQHVSSLQDQELRNQEAEMDALEARLFAMAKSHS